MLKIWKCLTISTWKRKEKPRSKWEKYTDEWKLVLLDSYWEANRLKMKSEPYRSLSAIT